MESVIRLSKDILARYDIPARNVVGHSDVAPTRKVDPGELFNWVWLAKEGIGINPVGGVSRLTGSHQAGRDPANPATPKGYAESQDLSDYGYDTTDLTKAITAFQRHFRQGNISGEWDEECERILVQLLRLD